MLFSVSDRAFQVELWQSVLKNQDFTTERS
jgi:hypothetical protein